jgi:hypothetical protein
MKINNLNHIEATTQEVVGAGYRCYRPGINTASADASANAYGRFTDASTYVDTLTVAGHSSGSYASASSTSIG